MRVCKLCKRELEDSEFSIQPSARDRRHSNCKQCRSVLEGIRKWGSIEDYHRRMRQKLADAQDSAMSAQDRATAFRRSLSHIERLMNEV